MSEWVDLSIYAVSSFVLWLMLPLAYRELAVPVMMDRNPEWVAANPAAVQRIARSRWFNNSCIVWGVITVAALLLAQLGIVVPGPLKDAPLWRQLNQIHSALFATGFVAFTATMIFVHRRLNRWIPKGATRSARLQPRTAADSVPRAWRIATEILTAGLFITWIVIGIAGIASSPKFWGGFAYLLAVSAALAVVARYSARRRPNYMDRVYGPAYRHREIRIVYGMRLAFVAFGVITLTGSIIGPASMPVDPARLSLLLFQLLFIGCLLSFVLMRPAETGAAPPYARGAKTSGLAASLILLIVVPIIAAASVSAATPAGWSAASMPSFRAPRAAESAGLPWVGRWLR